MLWLISSRYKFSDASILVSIPGTKNMPIEYSLSQIHLSIYWTECFRIFYSPWRALFRRAQSQGSVCSGMLRPSRTWKWNARSTVMTNILQWRKSWIYHFCGGGRESSFIHSLWREGKSNTGKHAPKLPEDSFSIPYSDKFMLRRKTVACGESSCTSIPFKGSGQSLKLFRSHVFGLITTLDCRGFAKGWNIF